MFTASYCDLFTFQGAEGCVGRVRGLAVPAPMRDAPPTPPSAQSGATARKIEIFSFEVLLLFV